MGKERKGIFPNKFTDSEVLRIYVANTGDFSYVIGKCRYQNIWKTMKTMLLFKA